MVESDVGWKAVAFILGWAGVLFQPRGPEVSLLEGMIPVVEEDLEHLPLDVGLFVSICSNPE